MTSAPRKVFTFSWKIENFSFNTTGSGRSMNSPQINLKSTEDTLMHLRFFPKGVDDASKDIVACFLSNGTAVNCKIDVAIEMLNSNGEILASMEKKRMTGTFVGEYRFLDAEKLTSSMENCKSDLIEIRCHVWDSFYNQPAVLCESCTEIEMKKEEFSWKIIIPKNQNWVKKINCPLQGNFPFNITLTSSDDQIRIKLDKLKEPTSKIGVLKVSILNNAGADVGLKNSTCSLESSEFITSFAKDQLESMPGFTSKSSFKLVCATYNSDGILRTKYVNYHYEDSSDDLVPDVGTPRFSLQDDLKDMFLLRKHCDVKLRAKNEIIPAHKCLLSARSPVFSTMFDQDMLETQTGIVDIPDVESETLQSFLEFLYTDTITNTDCEGVLKLMLVADKYQVSILKERCSELLMSKLSLESICDVISVAEMVNQFNLKQLALEYIKTNKRRIILSPEWSEWSVKNMKLANEILMKLSLD